MSPFDPTPIEDRDWFDLDESEDALDSEVRKSYCPYCLAEFDYAEEYDDHLENCEAFYPWTNREV